MAIQFWLISLSLTEEETALVISGVCKECRKDYTASEKCYLRYLIVKASHMLFYHEHNNKIDPQYRIALFVNKLTKHAKNTNYFNEYEIKLITRNLIDVSIEFIAATNPGYRPYISIAEWVKNSINEITRGLNINLLKQYKETLSVKESVKEIAKEVTRITRYFDCEEDHSIPCDDECEENGCHHDEYLPCDCVINLRLRVYDGSFEVLDQGDRANLDNDGFDCNLNIQPNDDPTMIAQELIRCLGE